MDKYLGIMKTQNVILVLLLFLILCVITRPSDGMMERRVGDKYGNNTLFGEVVASQVTEVNDCIFYKEIHLKITGKTLGWGALGMVFVY